MQKTSENGMENQSIEGFRGSMSSGTFPECSTGGCCYVGFAKNRSPFKRVYTDI